MIWIGVYIAGIKKGHFKCPFVFYLNNKKRGNIQMQKFAVGDLIDFDEYYDVDFKKLKVGEIKELYRHMVADYDYNAQSYIDDFEQVIEWLELSEKEYNEIINRNFITKQNFYELLRNIESDLKNKLNIEDNRIIKAVDIALSRFLK